jgi:hypothetical protein
VRRRPRSLSSVLQPVPVLLRLAEHVGHLPLERVEPLIERDHRRLRRRGLVGKARGVRRPPLGKHLALDLLDLPLEPLEPLLGRRRRRCASAAEGESGECRAGREKRNRTKIHELHPACV